MREDNAAARRRVSGNGRRYQTSAIRALAGTSGRRGLNAGRFVRPHLDWSGRRDLNPRQPAWKAGTLPLSHSRPLPSSIPQLPTQKVAAANTIRPNAPLCAKNPPCPYARLRPIYLPWHSQPNRRNAIRPNAPISLRPCAFALKTRRSQTRPCAKNPKPALSIRPSPPNLSDLNPQSPPLRPPPISLKIRRRKA